MLRRAVKQHVIVLNFLAFIVVDGSLYNQNDQLRRFNISWEIAYHQVLDQTAK